MKRKIILTVKFCLVPPLTLFMNKKIRNYGCFPGKVKMSVGSSFVGSKYEKLWNDLSPKRRKCQRWYLLCQRHNALSLGGVSKTKQNRQKAPQLIIPATLGAFEPACLTCSFSRKCLFIFNNFSSTMTQPFTHSPLEISFYCRKWQLRINHVHHLNFDKLCCDILRWI